MKATIANSLTSVLFDEALFKGDIAERNGTRVLTYDCQRIARVSRARAIGLLMSYTASLGRPEYDPDFGVVGDAAVR